MSVLEQNTRTSRLQKLILRELRTCTREHAASRAMVKNVKIFPANACRSRLVKYRNRVSAASFFFFFDNVITTSLLSISSFFTTFSTFLYRTRVINQLVPLPKLTLRDYVTDRKKMLWRKKKNNIKGFFFFLLQCQTRRR